MGEVLTNIKTNNLREIHLVDVIDQVISLIPNTFVTIDKDNESDDLHKMTELTDDIVASTIWKRTEGSLKPVQIQKGIQVFFYQTDMPQLKADAVVCPNDETLSCSTGVAKNIADLVGNDYKMCCQEAVKNREIHPSDVVSINTDNLGIIINAIVAPLTSFSKKDQEPDYDGYKEMLNKTFQGVIDEVERHGVSYVAMSNIGPGN